MEAAVLREHFSGGAAVARTAGGVRRFAGVPWFCWAVVLGATCIPLGTIWDISWHSTIGRDTFWTPAHLLIHFGGLLSGFTAGWLAIQTSFFASETEKRSAVRLFRFHAPLGAWVIIWGAMAMLFSAPFDNWWHNAYGLDVAILSPPHTVLAAGMYAVAAGGLLLVLANQNRSGENESKTGGNSGKAGSLLFTYAAGILLTMSTIILTEKSFPNQQHGSLFYALCAATYPLYLVGAAKASRLGWGATVAALVYMGVMLGFVWLLPLFPAEPKLAPIYNPVTHMVPPSFPLLLVAPAIGVDLVMRTVGRRAGFWWNFVTALCCAVVFLGLLMAVQWPFAKFLLSPGADNWFFSGNRHWPYFAHVGEWRQRFWRPEEDPLTLRGILIALGLAVASARVALGFGTWMRKAQR